MCVGWFTVYGLREGAVGVELLASLTNFAAGTAADGSLQSNYPGKFFLKFLHV